MAGMNSTAVPPRSRFIRASESEVDGHSRTSWLLFQSYCDFELTFIYVNQDQGTLLADAIVSQISARREIGSFVAPQHELLAEPTRRFSQSDEYAISCYSA
jgi:hypothetical protein